jgi:hypothetical protein
MTLPPMTLPPMTLPPMTLPPMTLLSLPSRLDLDHDTLEIVAISAAAVAALSFVLVLLALLRVRALNKKLRRLATSSAGPVTREPGADPHALRHVGVVRYDAFQDMGGRMSFSAAFFDDNGDGIVLSSINGRTETRTYAKALIDLRSDHSLSPEEQQAIDAARRD